MYFLAVQIVLSSASSMNSIHFRFFVCFISCLYLALYSLHSFPSVSLPLLLYLFLALLVYFLNSDKSLVHHLLLWGHGFLRGVDLVMAVVIREMSNSAYSSSCMAVGCVLIVSGSVLSSSHLRRSQFVLS